MRGTISSIVILALSTSVFAQAQTDVEATGDGWPLGTNISFSQTNPKEPGSVRYEFTLASANELRIRMATEGLKEAVDGEMMLVSNVLLVRNLPVTPGYEIDLIDGAGIELQVVHRLLEFAAPAPPSKLHERLQVQRTERKEPLRVGTTSAYGEYPTPWSVKGWLERTSSSEIRFDLSLTFVGEGKKATTVNYAGSWIASDPPPSFPDSLEIKGWAVYDFGYLSDSSPHGTTLDYGAKKSAKSFNTLGQLRAAALAGNERKEKN